MKLMVIYTCSLTFSGCNKRNRDDDLETKEILKTLEGAIHGYVSEYQAGETFEMLELVRLGKVRFVDVLSGKVGFDGRMLNSRSIVIVPNNILKVNKEGYVVDFWGKPIQIEIDEKAGKVWLKSFGSPDGGSNQSLITILIEL